MPAIPNKQEQKEVNDLLNQALELMKKINGAVDNNADTFKNFKAGVADASATATAYLKKVTDAGKYTGEGLGKGVVGFEKTSKFINENFDDIVSGVMEIPEGLKLGAASAHNLANYVGPDGVFNKGLEEAVDSVFHLQEVISDPKTHAAFEGIDSAASSIQSSLDSIPGGKVLQKAFGVDVADGAKKLKGNMLKVATGKGSVKDLLAGTKLLKVGMLAVAAAVVSFGLEANKVQKDLGVSYSESAKILATSKSIALVNKANGMTQEDTLAIMKGIASEFGSFSDATASATLQASNLVANFGLSADSVGTLARQMQAVGEGSLDSALNSIELQANMARAADVPVGEVMNDVAKNTELFAKFGKDGGGNITAAAIAAKKLGLELSNVASIADSLLNFEDSIAKQMEAEVLLGKELNLEKAREMVFNNDIAGAMEEISRLVSPEEFEAMDAVRRSALAAAVGLDAGAMAKAISAGGAGGGITPAMRTGGAVAGGGRATDSEQTKIIGEKLDNLTMAVKRQGTP